MKYRNGEYVYTGDKVKLSKWTAKELKASAGVVTNLGRGDNLIEVGTGNRVFLLSCQSLTLVARK